MRDKSQSFKAKKDIKKRQHLMERTFARATRYGFDRARWRGLMRVSIQEFLICSVQNIQSLIKPKIKPKQVMAMALKQEKYEIKSYLPRKMNLIRDFFTKNARLLGDYFRSSVFLCANLGPDALLSHH